MDGCRPWAWALTGVGTGSPSGRYLSLARLHCLVRIPVSGLSSRTGLVCRGLWESASRLVEVHFCSSDVAVERAVLLGCQLSGWAVRTGVDCAGLDSWFFPRRPWASAGRRDVRAVAFVDRVDLSSSGSWKLRGVESRACPVAFSLLPLLWPVRRSVLIAFEDPF